MTRPRTGVAPKNGIGTAALVVAVAGLLFCWSVLGGVVCGVAGIVLGILGRARAARDEADNGAVATAGLALGAVAILAAIAFAVIWSNAWRDSDGSEYVDCAVRAGNDQNALERCGDTWLDTIQTKFGITVKAPTPGREST